jgi:hypothetical protein
MAILAAKAPPFGTIGLLDVPREANRYADAASLRQDSLPKGIDRKTL